MVRLIVDDKYQCSLELKFPEQGFYSIIHRELGDALSNKTPYEIEFCLRDPAKEFAIEQSLRKHGIHYTVIKSSMPKH